MKILSVIVLYYPNLELLQKNIDAFLCSIDHLIIWDNSPIQNKEENEDFCRQHYAECSYIGTGENKGISVALNYAWKYAQEHDYDTLLTMDQDSIFVHFDNYKNHVAQKWEKEGECLCGPTPNLHLDRNTKYGFTSQPEIITSGMMIPISLLNLCGGFCTSFLIDGIDVEFCYHVREKGQKVFRDNESNLIQQFGEPLSRTFYHFTLHAHGYSSNRLYHIFRNHLMIWRKYQYPAQLLKKILYDYLLKMVLIGVIFVENDKIEKLNAVLHGIRDGIMSKNLIEKQ